MRLLATALLTCGILQLTSWAGGAEGDLSTLVDSSERIAIVRILSVDPPQLGKPTAQAAVSVVHTLKGGEDPGSLNLKLPEQPHPNPTKILVGRDYLVFLDRSGGVEDWTLDSAVSIFRIDAAYVEPFTDNTERDVLELLHRSLDSSNPETQADVLKTLAAIDEAPVSFARARELSDSRSEVVAARAMIYRMKKEDEVDTGLVVSFVEQSKALSEIDTRELAFLAVYDAPLSVAEQNKLLAESSSPDIRSVAAAALHFRGDETSVPVLLEAVSSDDPLVAVHAHEGLKRITSRAAPVLSEFKATVPDVGDDWQRWVEEWKAAKSDSRE